MLDYIFYSFKSFKHISNSKYFDSSLNLLNDWGSKFIRIKNSKHFDSSLNLLMIGALNQNKVSCNIFKISYFKSMQRLKYINI